jgi:hypothetical protein
MDISKTMINMENDNELTPPQGDGSKFTYKINQL